MSEFYDFEYLNNYNGRRSPAGTVEDDYTTQYFMRCLYQRAISVFDWTLPEGWNKKYFTNVLFRNGFIAVIPTAKYGIIPQVCTLTGYGLYLQPTEVLVGQPLVNYRGKIGTDCELITLTPDYMGIWDIIEHYARQLSEIYTSIQMSLKNSRLSFLLGAKNKAAADTLKIIAEKISSGEPVIVYDKKMTEDINGESPLWVETFDPSKSYITDQLLADMSCILSDFDKEIGIPNVDEKKERMITDEVQIATADSCARVTTWENCLKESVDNVNRMFKLNLRFARRGGVYNDQDKPDRNVQL